MILRRTAMIGVAGLCLTAAARGGRGADPHPPRGAHDAGVGVNLRPEAVAAGAVATYTADWWANGIGEAAGAATVALRRRWDVLGLMAFLGGGLGVVSVAAGPLFGVASMVVGLACHPAGQADDAEAMREEDGQAGHPRR